MMLNKDQDEVRDEEEELRKEVANLSNIDRKKFYREAEKNVKDPDTYAVLNYLFLTGLHHFYLKKYQRGFINLAIFIVGIVGLTTWISWSWIQWFEIIL